MTQGQVDTVDLAAMPAFLIGSLYSVGYLEQTLPVIGDPGATFTTFLGVDFSLAVILSLAALLVVVYTNDWSYSSSSGIAGWVVIATFGFVLSPPLMPAVAEAINGGVGAIVAIATQTTGYSIASFLG